MVGCNNRVRTGCKTHGMRFCLWGCFNKHLAGRGQHKRLKVEVEWRCEDCE